MGADMALILWLLTALVPCLIGMGALRILYGSQAAQDTAIADCALTGGMIVIGLAEAAHLGAVILGWSFSRSVLFFEIAIVVVFLAAVLVVLWNWKRSGAFSGRKKEICMLQCRRKGARLPWLAFGLLLIGQLIYVITRQGVYVDGDMTLETVGSFLESDQVYQINPMTGRTYTLGMPLRLKILCLPTLYGALCSLFGVEAEMLVYGMIPSFVLVAGYIAYGTVAKNLFPEDIGKRGLFMMLAALLLTAGDYMYGMDGFGVLHSGFRGVAIRGVVLLPYVFGLMLRKKYKLVLLCILAEACMVWTLYGMGACVLVSVGMFSTELILRFFVRGRRNRAAAICKEQVKHGEEAGYVGDAE